MTERVHRGTGGILLESFYKRCLTEATRYRRAAGFFSSSVFQAAELSGLANLASQTLAFSLAVGQFNDDNGDGTINSLDTPDVAVSNRRDETVGAKAGSLTIGKNTIVPGALQVEFTASQHAVSGVDFALGRLNLPPRLNNRVEEHKFLTADLYD